MVWKFWLRKILSLVINMDFGLDLQRKYFSPKTTCCKLSQINPEHDQHRRSMVRMWDPQPLFIFIFFTMTHEWIHSRWATTSPETTLIHKTAKGILFSEPSKWGTEISLNIIKYYYISASCKRFFYTHVKCLSVIICFMYDDMHKRFFIFNCFTVCWHTYINTQTLWPAES